MSGTTARVPAGSDAATSPTRLDTDAPDRHVLGLRADQASEGGAGAVGRPRSSPPSSCGRAASRSSACCSASHAGCGGRP